MHSKILVVTTRFLFPLMILFSVFLLIRGHNEPGGGFTGGLVAACAFALHALGGGVGAVRRALPVSPDTFMGGGLLVAAASGLPGLASGGFLQSTWGTLAGVKVGTPILFDVGVYLVVVGVILKALLAMMEERT